MLESPPARCMMSIFKAEPLGEKREMDCEGVCQVHCSTSKKISRALGMHMGVVVLSWVDEVGGV